MKVIVQVPCLNEAQTLPEVLAGIPRRIPGVDVVEVLVVDDGSVDGTAAVAREHGADHVIRHTRTLGLARSFRDGVHHALSLGADIVVNTDGDNQYPQDRIGDLVTPILAGQADIVIGDRQTATIRHFSAFKRAMQRVGSAVVNAAAGTRVPDAASGFRAYSKGALLRLNIVTSFSYCMETIIQAGNKRMRIVSVPITTNRVTRPSRLSPTMFHHMGRSAVAIIRSYVMFRPYMLFGALSALLLVAGSIPFVRFLGYAVAGDSGGHVQSLLFGTALVVAGLISAALLVIADLLRTNRILLEDLLERTKTASYRRADEPGDARRQ